MDKSNVMDIATLIATDESPASMRGMRWILGDDKCDCLFQRIGEWSNPFLGRTMRVRLCCLWAKIYEQYPEFVQQLPYHEPNKGTYTSEVLDWDSEQADMPLYLWYRQLSIKERKPLKQIREEHKGREHERPKKVKMSRKKHPTIAELRHAKEERLRASGWLLPGQTLADMPGLEDAVID